MARLPATAPWTSSEADGGAATFRPAPARVEPVEDLRIPAQAGVPLSPWLRVVTPPHGQPVPRRSHPMRISQAPQSHPPEQKSVLSPAPLQGMRRRRVYGRGEGRG